MKKVISFSLWGDNLNYTKGAIENALLAKQKYPEFECWFYIHKPSVPMNIINKLKVLSNVKIIYKYSNILIDKPMMWRFEAIDDPNIEIMLSRDVDTRILDREVEAVNEWLKTDKLFHIMRDHPHHGMKILGGMFGTKKIAEIPSWKKLIDVSIQKGIRDYDTIFLEKIIYPIVIKHSYIHSTFSKFDDEIINKFPSEYVNYHHVGEYIDANNKQSNNHIKILRDYINKPQ